MEYYVHTYYRQKNEVLFIEKIQYHSPQFGEEGLSWTGLQIMCRSCSERVRNNDEDSSYLYNKYVPDGQMFQLNEEECADFIWLNHPCETCLAMKFINTHLYRFVRGIPALPKEYERRVFYPQCEIRFNMGRRVSKNLFVDCPYYMDKNSNYCYSITDKEIATIFSKSCQTLLINKNNIETVLFESPYHYLLPSELQAYLSLCCSQKKIFGASHHIDNGRDIYDGEKNPTAWYQTVSNMTSQGYYKISIIDGLCSFIVDEDATLGIIFDEELSGFYEYCIVGIPEKVEAFCKLIGVPYEPVE